MKTSNRVQSPQFLWIEEVPRTACAVSGYKQADQPSWFAQHCFWDAGLSVLKPGQTWGNQSTLLTLNVGETLFSLANTRFCLSSSMITGLVYVSLQHGHRMAMSAGRVL